MTDEIQQLVEFPSETLDVELKEWLDLNSNLNRAKLARHICALANYGGGYIVFGISDAGNHMEVSEFKPQYSIDSISSIVKKYLNPAFQCSVVTCISKMGTEHVVVVVPSHGDSPICAIAGGPNGLDGRPQGITPGTHYIRSPGPESAPLTNPADWKAVIQRCVLARKDDLLKDFAAIVSPRAIQRVEPEIDFLGEWHKAISGDYAYRLIHGKLADWPVPLLTNRYHFSYRLIDGGDAPVKVNQLLPLLREANHRMKAIVHTGWSMFFPFDPQEIRPKIKIQTISGNEKEFYESDLTGEGGGMLDFWCFSTDGYAALIRGYREDRGPVNRGSTKSLSPGGWFSPVMLAQDVAEFICHAIAMAELTGAQSIELNFSWIGLKERRISDNSGRFFFEQRVSATDSRQVRKTVERVSAKAELHELIAEIINPILRLFDGLEVNGNWIKSLMPDFRKL